MNYLDSYNLLKVLKRGVFGTVCLYERIADNKQTVIKQILYNQSEDDDLKESQNEVHILEKLYHPHIIEYFDSFTENHCLHIVMEFATNSTLYDFVKRRNNEKLPQNEVLYLFSQLVLAVNFIHSLNILHRDIKPCNILMTGKNGNVLKLSDFGISKLLNTTSKANSIVGTPSYLSPELCLGKPYSTESDIWSMGCVLYFMTTQKIAFEAMNLGSMVFNILQGVITEPLNDIYEPAVTQLIANMLEREPEHRPKTSQLMANKLLIGYIYGIMLNHGLEYENNIKIINCKEI